MADDTFDIGELLQLTTTDGDFDRRLPFDTIRVPHVEVSLGGQLKTGH